MKYLFSLSLLLTLFCACKSTNNSNQSTPAHKGNHLVGQSSPYLLQHAQNPVDWYPWGDAAFAKAKRENKPILLSIGYSTCHWCHVMERESFEDEKIAELLNEHFVCIKSTKLSPKLPSDLPLAEGRRDRLSTKYPGAWMWCHIAGSNSIAMIMSE